MEMHGRLLKRNCSTSNIEVLSRLGGNVPRKRLQKFKFFFVDQAFARKFKNLSAKQISNRNSSNLDFRFELNLNYFFSRRLICRWQIHPQIRYLRGKIILNLSRDIFTFKINKYKMTMCSLFFCCLTEKQWVYFHQMNFSFGQQTALEVPIMEWIFIR